MTTYAECEYDKHTAVLFVTMFRDDDGDPITPSTVTADVARPDGIITTYATSDDELNAPVTADIPTATATAMGISVAENATPWTGIAGLTIVLSQEGDYLIRWKGVGGATIGSETRVTVKKTIFD